MQGGGQLPLVPLPLLGGVELGEDAARETTALRMNLENALSVASKTSGTHPKPYRNYRDLLADKTVQAGLIGAINAALIAGNPPERRVERLRDFWETVTAPPNRTISAIALPRMRRVGRTPGRSRCDIAA